MKSKSLVPNLGSCDTAAGAAYLSVRFEPWHLLDGYTKPID